MFSGSKIWFIAIGSVIFCILSLLCCAIVIFYAQQFMGRVSVHGFVLSTDVDLKNKQAVNPTTRFPTTTKVIYASFFLNANDDELPIIVVWYKDGVVLAKQNTTSNIRWQWFWMHPKQGELFPVGQYKVQILFGELLLEEREFEIFQE